MKSHNCSSHASRAAAARATFLADVKVEGGDVAGAQALLKESIANEPGQMGLYSALGALQLRDGRYEEAARTYMSYPGLKANSQNTVELSNYLEPAGAGISRARCGCASAPALLDRGRISRRLVRQSFCRRAACAHGWPL
jgi:hypothetical protein